MIMAAALQRGLTLNDFKELNVGAIVDYVITYNNTYSENEYENPDSPKKATQQDFNNF